MLLRKRDHVEWSISIRVAMGAFESASPVVLQQSRWCGRLYGDGEEAKEA
jgi:hypothetical protein